MVEVYEDRLEIINPSGLPIYDTPMPPDILKFLPGYNE
jgi:predicted HTH transcriptional regulator